MTKPNPKIFDLKLFSKFDSEGEVVYVLPNQVVGLIAFKELDESIRSTTLLLDCGTSVRIFCTPEEAEAILDATLQYHVEVKKNMLHDIAASLQEAVEPDGGLPWRKPTDTTGGDFN